MVKIIKGIVFLILLAFFISFSASATLGNPKDSIGSTYGPGDLITGAINISLNNEPTNSVLKDSYGEEINLFDLIKKASNAGFFYVCNPALCISDYVASNEATSKTINLDENQTVLIGFNISRKNTLSDVTGFYLNLTSNNPETTKLPLIIDVLNDGQKEWTAYNPSNNFGNENFGCFQIATGTANVIQSQYCERIRLSKTPQVEIGAYVTHIGGSGTVPFTMSIKRVDSGQSRSCEADATDTGRVSCSAQNFPINQNGDYFVCIQTKNSVDANSYQINYEQNNPCGFTGTYESRYTYDFEIFARPKLYASGINFTFNNAELSKAGSPVTNIEQYIKSYIASAYNNNCSNDCIIPVSIYSGVAQQVTISGVSLTYLAGIATTTNKVYNIQETPAKINSNFQTLYIGEAGFHAPTDYGNSTFSISLGTNELVSHNINVKEVPVIKSISPTTTGAEYPTKFTIQLNESSNITEYNWDFGDGGLQTTAINSVTYTYKTTGTYSMKVTLIDNKGMNSSKEFTITVEPVSEIIPTLMQNAETNIAHTEAMIQSFSASEQKAINSSLGIDKIEADMAELRQEISSANSDAQFEVILGKLMAMKIPQTVAKTAYSDGLSFYTIGNNIDLSEVKDIGGGDYDATKEEDYKKSVIAWDEANTATTMIYTEISADYGTYQEPFLKIFDVTVTNNGGNAYLIIRNMNGILFDQDYSQQKKGDYYYIALDTAEKHVVFSTTDSVDFSNVPMFISPPISQLSLAEWTPFTNEGALKKWILFSIIALIIIIVAVVAWILLRIWYKKKYETYLFKNRNNLYNLINFIQAEKNKGTKEKEISEKLKKAGWNGEQIRYALRKHAGKRTGMPELITKRLEENKAGKK
jgi:PKD repeat protein